MCDILSTPYDSIACRTTFSRNNFLIFARSSLQRCFITLRFASLCLYSALLRSWCIISVRLRSCLWLGQCNTLILFFFSHSVVDLLVFLGSLSCCMTNQPSFTCQTDGFTFDSRILWYTDRVVHGRLNDCKVPRWMQNKPQSPPLCHHDWWTVGMRLLCWNGVFGLCQTWHYALLPNIFTLLSSVQRTLFQKSWRLFRCNFVTMFLC